MVTVELTEIDIPKVKTGSKATITLDALPDKTYTGKVTGIDTAGSVSSGVTTYPVVITLDTISPEIYSNMSATANIIIDSRESALYIPLSALQTQNGQSVVRVKSGNNISYVNVEIGLTTDAEVEIISGLNEGDEVVTSVVNTSSTSSPSGSSSIFGIRQGSFGGGGNVRIQGR
jgi:HlyD family secretion protein